MEFIFMEPGIFTMGQRSVPRIRDDGDVDEDDLSAYLLSSVGGNKFDRNKDFNLYQNYPNPFNPSTYIKLSLQKTVKVILEVYDILGRKVITLLNDEKIAGSYSIRWNGEDIAGRRVSSGVYFYELVAGEFIKTRKMTCLR